VLLLGGSSEIGLAIVRATSDAPSTAVCLLGRDEPRLSAAAQELRHGGYAQVTTGQVDANDTSSHERAIGEAFERLDGCDLVIVAVGVLGERGGLPNDLEGAVGVLRTNALGAGSLLLCAARRLADQGAGTLVVLSSVAAEVIRPANVVYGASKAALDGLALGLGDALHGTGVRVLVVRPGFVRTRMTRELRVGPLAIEAAAVGRAVARGLDRGTSIVWAPAALRWVMLALKLAPRRLIRRLPL
jgi:decaprenylphospho-beta-D-erythro-pentofuranosid-2-ulose 2-reductase